MSLCLNGDPRFRGLPSIHMGVSSGKCSVFKGEYFVDQDKVKFRNSLSSQAIVVWDGKIQCWERVVDFACKSTTLSPLLEQRLSELNGAYSGGTNPYASSTWWDRTNQNNLFTERKTAWPCPKRPIALGRLEGLGLHQWNLHSNLHYSSCPRTQKGGGHWPNDSHGRRLSYRDPKRPTFTKWRVRGKNVLAERLHYP